MSASNWVIRESKTPILSTLLWPTYLAVVLAAIFWADANDAHGPVRGALALGSIIFVGLIERMIPLDEQQLLRAERATLHDVGYLLLNALTGIMSGVLSLGSGWYVIRYVAPSLTEFAIWPTSTPWFVQCVLAVVAADFLGYWVHRAEHRFPSLWAYHVIHHKIERLHILRGSREHFVTSLVRGFFIFGPLVVLGAPFEALFGYQVLAITYGSIAHGNLALRLPGWSHRWFLTPPVHRIHHATNRALSDSNYSTITPVWDRLFGTWTDPTTQPPPQIGAEGESVPDDFLGQQAVPFRRWLERLG